MDMQIEVELRVTVLDPRSFERREVLYSLTEEDTLSLPWDKIVGNMTCKLSARAMDAVEAMERQQVTMP